MSPPREEPRHLERLVRALRSTAREVTPWFMKQMPESYFRDADEATVTAHLAAIVAARIGGAAPRMLLRDEEEETWTFIQERSYRGLLSDLMEQLPRGRPLASAKVHTAGDDSLILDVFRFGEAPRCDLSVPELAAKRDEAVAYARGLGDHEAPEALPRYLERASVDFVRSASPLRIHETWRLVQAVEGTDEVATAVSLQRESGLTRISLAAGNADTQRLLARVVNHLGREGLDITRAFLDVFDGASGWVSSLGFVVHDDAGALLDESAPAWRGLAADLARLPWVDDDVLARLARHPEETLVEAEVVVALARLAHARLARREPHVHTRDRLFAYLDTHAEAARDIARLLLDRFVPGPPAPDEELEARARGILERVGREVELEPARQLLELILEAALAVLRTNAFVEGRAGLALAMNPGFFEGGREGRPHAVLFVHGGGFDGYHVRFADLARGGVRLVRPASEEQHVIEAERVYEEAASLAEAQHLKNKDIPEGGAKGVVLLGLGAPVTRAARAFVDGLLDLCAPHGGQVVDRGAGFGSPLHLGPDEGITPELIEWATARAAARGHPLPGAFMSSKPGAGINHKAYGVTSEGVAVFLAEALRAAGIDPRTDRFTVKLTGGPDGDVAGNMLRILDRDYGARAQVVGVADGTGSAWDPGGLAPDELFRLVEQSAGIAAFDRARLGPEGRVVPIGAPEGPHARNALVFELRADAFVPAGGRPGTIHGGNWRRLLGPEGPTSRVIVEGANLFLTPEARLRLSEAGMLIVKDSSANKCGVISSSLEIAASMILDDAGWARHKPRLVEEVLERLRELAGEEARRLFADHARDPSIPLSRRSEELSKAILRVTEAVEAALPGVEPGVRAELDEVVKAFLPPVLVEAAGERLAERLSRRYRDRVVATRLAANLVYREGVEVLEQLPAAGLGEAALRYHARSREVARLAAELRASSLEDGARAAALLEAGGARPALFDEGAPQGSSAG